MKKDKVVYWSITVIVALGLGFSGYSYLTNPAMQAGFKHLGFPDYFRIELGIAKLIAAVVLLVPGISFWVKEWAYAAIGITFISAVIAHISSGDAAGMVVAPLMFLVFLVVSYRYFHKLNTLQHSQLA
ncbi:DoxX family protein [Spirosoma areae]